MAYIANKVSSIHPVLQRYTGTFILPDADYAELLLTEFEYPG
jgi:hypothetical protein